MTSPSSHPEPRSRFPNKPNRALYLLLLARDLRLLEPKPYAELAEATTEVKRMLAALLQKLIADR